MKKLIYIGLGFILSWPVMSQAQRFTIDEAVVYAVEHSRDMERALLNMQDAELELKELKSIGLPQLRGASSYQYNFEIAAQPTEDFISPAVIGILNDNNVTPDPITIPEPEVFQIPFGQRHNFNVGVTADWQIFDGSYLVGLEAQKLYRELLNKQLHQAEYVIRSDVSKAYINILIQARNAELLRKNIKSLTTIRDETKLIYEEGFAEKLDVDRLNLSIRRLETGVDNLTRAVDLAKNVLKLHMNYPLDQEIHLVGGIEELLERYTLMADSVTYRYEDRPEYAVLEQNVALNEINIKRYEKGFLPTVHAIGGITRSLQDGDFIFGNNSWINSSYIGLNINVPIYDGGYKKARIERTRLDVEKARLTRSEFEQGMDVEISNALIGVRSAEAQRILREENMDLAQEIYDTALIKFKEGVGSSLELTQAESDFISAEQEYIDSLYEVLSAQIELHRALGLL